MKLTTQLCSLSSVVLAAVLWISAPAIGATVGSPKVCNSPELVRAIKLIQRACTDASCDFDDLRSLDSKVNKSSLMAALRDPNLSPVHIFFPRGVSSLSLALDWGTFKQDQLDTLRYLSNPRDAAVFIIGRASSIGDPDANRRLSQGRMQAVLKYLRDDLRINCHSFHGGYLGEEILQLTASDVRLLNIEPRDFREDYLILNQSVHVFVFPCKEIL